MHVVGSIQVLKRRMSSDVIFWFMDVFDVGISRPLLRSIKKTHIVKYQYICTHWPLAASNTLGYNGYVIRVVLSKLILKSRKKYNIILSHFKYIMNPSVVHVIMIYDRDAFGMLIYSVVNELCYILLIKEKSLQCLCIMISNSLLKKPIS